MAGHRKNSGRYNNMLQQTGEGLQQASFWGFGGRPMEQTRIKPKTGKVIVMREIVQELADQTRGEHLFMFQ